MPNENIEQETLTESEVISLLNTETPAVPARKGYEDYVAEAAAEASSQDAGQVEESNTDDDLLPEKFKGKSAAEIAASYAQLESEFGRRNNEVGSLRKLTDQLLELKKETSETATEARKKVDVDSLLTNPDDVINSAVDSNPRIKALEEKLLNADIAKEKAKFEGKYPDWATTLNTPEFAAWIKESPVRSRLLIEADANYDYATGTELFDMYTESKGNAIEDAKTARNAKARNTAKQAVTESGGANVEKSKPKFRRTELIQLKLTNPGKYEAMLPEIMEAYAQKRVI